MVSRCPARTAEKPLPAVLLAFLFLVAPSTSGGGVEITANPGVGKPFSESACPRGTGQGGDQL